MLPHCLLKDILLTELGKRSRIDIQGLKRQLQPKKITPQHTLIASPPDFPTLPKLVHLVAALLVQDPSLVSAITGPLPKSHLSGYAFIVQLVDLLKEKPFLTAGALREYWRGQQEEGLIAMLAKWEHTIPEKGIKDEFSGAVRQLMLLAFDEEIDCLLAKAAQEGLTESEKMRLSQSIAKKKSFLVKTP